MFADPSRAADRPQPSQRRLRHYFGVRHRFPGYDSILPKSAGTIGNILVDNGYDTSWFGKHHLIPDWQQSTAGPFAQWAGGLGFEYFYGFLGGDTDNWHPALF